MLLYRFTCTQKNNAAILDQVDKAGNELLQLVAPLSEVQINIIPFADSWTAAQLTVHITKSNNAIVQALDMQGSIVQRKPAEHIAELKKIFLNFKHTMKSPAFIEPRPGNYKKEPLLAALQKSNALLKEKAMLQPLAEVIEFSAFGRITKLELLYFVLYHTQRHIHQLKNICRFI